MNPRDAVREGAHIFLSENNPIPRWIGPILSIAQVIKFVMTSAAEAELAALYITAQKLVPMRQTLIEMGWPQPPTPIQTDNTTDEGVANNKIFTKKLKSMHLRLHWLRCRESQKKIDSTGTKDPTTGVTITQSNTHKYITRQSAPFLKGALT